MLYNITTLFSVSMKLIITLALGFLNFIPAFAVSIPTSQPIFDHTNVMGTQHVVQEEIASEPHSVLATASLIEPEQSTAPTKTLSGGLNWVALRACESGGNYANKKNPTYRGAYQFSYATWQSVGGSGDPADASPAEQDSRAQMLYDRSGAGQWPVCGKLL